MKKKITMSVVTLLTLFSLTLSPAMFSGCNSTPKRVEYNVAAGAQLTIETAMVAWGDYVHLKHPSVAVEKQVRDAYEKYQRASVAHLDVRAALVAQGTNADLAARERALVAAQSASTALLDLFNTLHQFGVKF